MAKTDFWLSFLPGRLGGVTFCKTKGGKVYPRTIVTPNNPKTEAQQEQRILMLTVNTAYRQLQGLCNHTFEGIASGRQSMGRFYALNLRMLRQTIDEALAAGLTDDDIRAFTPLGTSQLVPNAYYVALGSLPEVTPVLPDALPSVAQMPLSANSYQAVIDDYGLARGDVLTFVAIEGEEPTRQQFRAVSIVLDPTYGDGAQAPLSEPLVADDGTIHLPSPQNEGCLAMLAYTPGCVSYELGGDTIGAAGIIVSRKRRTSWQYSNCQLVCGSAQGGSGYCSMRQALDLALGRTPYLVAPPSAM